MKPYISPLAIEKVSGNQYAITDGNGEKLILLDRLFDASICLFMSSAKQVQITDMKSKIPCSIMQGRRLPVR